MNINVRRDFLRKSSALMGASLLPYSSLVRAEPPPEVRKLRLINIPAICHAPQYLAEAMLKLEGFTEVEYVDFPTAGPTGATSFPPKTANPTAKPTWLLSAAFRGPTATTAFEAVLGQEALAVPRAAVVISHLTAHRCESFADARPFNAPVARFSDTRR